MGEYLCLRVLHITIHGHSEAFVRFFGPEYPEIVFSEASVAPFVRIVIFDLEFNL